MERVSPFKKIKECIMPSQVALKYLGNPSKMQGSRMWYKSPLRQEERTASFLVDERGFYDFGISKFYDIVDFTSCLFKVKPFEAVKILSKDFNINISEDKISKEELDKIKEENLKHTKHVKDVNLFYDEFREYVIDEMEDLNVSIYNSNKIYVTLKNLYLNNQIQTQDLDNYKSIFFENVENSFECSKTLQDLFIVENICSNIKNFKQKETLYNTYLNSIDENTKEFDLNSFTKELKEIDEFEIDYEMVFENYEEFFSQNLEQDDDEDLEE